MERRGPCADAGTTSQRGRFWVRLCSSLVTSDSTDRYEPGAHLRVRRRSGYLHHGIYLGQDQVAQFGGRVADKARAGIGVVSLAAFEDGGSSHEVPARVVDRWSGLYLHEPGAAEEVIERALWLVENYPVGRYNLLGNNCETMAIWCRSGGSTESMQVRGVLYAVRAFIVFPTMFLLLPLLKRRGRISEAQLGRLQAAVFAVHLIPTAIWAWHRWRFAKYITTTHPPTVALLDAERRQAL